MQTAARRAWLRWLAGFRRAVLGRRKSPEALARSAAVGLLVAFTPTVGVQIPIVLFIWAMLRRSWPFSAPAAIAWTFVSNVFTVPPIYYVFLVTGRLMLGHPPGESSFARFVARLEHTGAAGGGWLQQLASGALGVIDEFGLPMLVGSLPWALLAAMVGYRVVLVIARRRAARRAARMARGG